MTQTPLGAGEPPGRISYGTILIADDDPILLETLTAAMSAAGWQVRTAVNGKQAVEIAKSVPLDAMVLDMRMPELDGYEVCLELMRLGIYVPILLITASLGDCEPLGFLNVRQTLRKPVDVKQVIRFARTCRPRPVVDRQCVDGKA